jgi:CheY-like chemotaxis protein
MSEGHAVLLVDDEHIVLRALRDQLRRVLGGEVVVECAASASEAWEVLDDFQAAGVRVVLVFADWLMPETRGDVFLADVQARLPGVKRVMLTGQADADVLRRVVEEGLVDKLLFKPWSEDDLRGAMALALSG